MVTSRQICKSFWVDWGELAVVPLPSLSLDVGGGGECCRRVLVSLEKKNQGLTRHCWRGEQEYILEMGERAAQGKALPGV